MDGADPCDRRLRLVPAGIGGDGDEAGGAAQPAEHVPSESGMIPHARQHGGVQHLHQQRRDAAHHHRRDVAMHAPDDQIRPEQAVVAARHGALALRPIVEHGAHLVDDRLTDRPRRHEAIDGDGFAYHAACLRFPVLLCSADLARDCPSRDGAQFMKTRAQRLERSFRMTGSFGSPANQEVPMANLQTDDAPLASSKRSHAVDEATEALIEPKGDALVGRAVTINRPRAELYAYWRDFANLATVMENVERVDVLDDRRSHWVVKAPGGRTVEWDRRHHRGARRRASSPGPRKRVPTCPIAAASISATLGARGTIVTATILYDPPAGAIGKLIAKMFQREPAIQARRDLRRFKQLMETGEIATASLQRAPSLRRRRTDACAHAWHGKHDVRVDTVADPEILNPRDAIIKVTSTAICGSDLHLYDGYHPDDDGGRRSRPRVHGRGGGSRPQIHPEEGAAASWCRSPSPAAAAIIAASTNIPPATTVCPPTIRISPRTLYGQPMSGLFGYSHMTGGYAGGQAEYVRVPFSDVGPIVDARRCRGREGAVPLRHPAHGLAGGRDMPTSSPATLSPSGAAARSGCSRSSPPS